jgi:hypothetical protein
MNEGDLLIKRGKFVLSDTAETKKNEILPSPITISPQSKALQEAIFQLREQEILDFYQPLFDAHQYYEIIMTTATHLELLLQECISIKISKEINLFKDSSFYDLINVAYLLEILDQEQAKALHNYRQLRNNYAHEFLFHKGSLDEAFMQNVGDGMFRVVEVQGILDWLRLKGAEK